METISPAPEPGLPSELGDDRPGRIGARSPAVRCRLRVRVVVGAPDRQTVAGWFEPGSTGSSNPPTIPDSVGRVEPPEWSRSLPGRFEFAAADQFDEFSSRLAPPSADFSTPQESPLDEAGQASVSSGARPMSPEPLTPGLKAIQVHDSYLIAETAEGMMVIDQHALHERILYEELRQRVAAER